MAGQKNIPGQNMPKLGWVDQAIYWTAILLTMGFSLSGIFISVIAQEHVAFSDSRVIAFTVGEGNLNSFFLIFWCLIAFVVILAGFQQHRVPLFGRSDASYGPPKYNPVYPLFRKDNRRKKLTASQKRWRILIIVLIVLSFLFSAAMFPRSFYGRAVLLDDGTIAVYDTSNELTRSYSAAEIVEVRLNTYADGKYSRNWKAEMVVYTRDQEFFRFAASSFAGDDLQQLQTMLDMKARYAPLVAIQGADDLASVIRSQKYGTQEQALLHELFQPVQ